MIRGVAGKIYRHYVAGTEYEVGLSHEDLIHAGVVGYLEAGKRHQQGGNSDSSSFYYMNVKGRMLDLVRKQAMVRIPQLPYAKLKELMAARNELEQAGTDAAEEQLAEKLGYSVEEVSTLLASVPRVFSADRSGRPDEYGDADYYDTLLTSKQKKTVQLDRVLKKEISGLIQLCLDRLESGRQRLILAARYLEDMRLRELAESFGCTEQAVHYQERKGLQQMQSCLEKNGWQWDGSEK